MKAECFLRVARKPRARWNENQFMFEVTVTEPREPLRSAQNVALRTAVIKLNLEFPEGLFGPAAEVDISVPARACKVLGEASL